MTGIPHTFHRVWLGPHAMPESFAAMGKTWRDLHPNWRMVTWIDATIPALLNQPLYDRAPTAAIKSNIARYELLLHHGGIYVDTDFECLKNLEPLLDGVNCFVAIAGEGLANNAIIGCVPGHPFVYDLVVSLEEYVQHHSYDDAHVGQSGPVYLTHVLGRHPEVTVFGPELFYPYAWHERWRAGERFDDAYAVHHWSLTWRESMRPTSRRLGDGCDPCLSVIVEAVDSGPRLRWVLEGLTVQTVSDFEVIVTSSRRNDAGVDTAIAAVADRLRIRKVHARTSPHAQANRRVLGLVQAPRVLFIAGDCLPDTDVVETHARYGDDGVVAFGFRRAYPGHKYYDFRAPLDYDGLRRHCSDDIRLQAPLWGDWRDVVAWPVSAPTAALARVRALRPPRTINARELARQLSREMFRLRPLWEAGYVTELLAHT